MQFPAPLHRLNDQLQILELWHGPSLAFKDFGAQFMAQLMSYYNQDHSKELQILVATSGDTGSAIAAGFHKVPGINVVILFPKDKISPLQEKQMTTYGDNISAIEIEGTFDDCQDLVKQAFSDQNLSATMRLSSANSINIARLIPQMFYYIEAYRQTHTDDPLIFSVPSGNFGNLTAGLFTKKMGLPIARFLASTNVNDVVPKYLQTKRYTPRPSVETLSNAMDVGNPSNFARILDLYGSTWNNIVLDISGSSITDEQTIQAIQEVYYHYNYAIDPHGAVAYLGAKQFLASNPSARIIILETAHPSKFKSVMDRALNIDTPIHPTLAALAHTPSQKITLTKDYSAFKSFLLDHVVSL